MNYKRSFKDWLARREWKEENYQEAERIFRENAVENPNIGQFHFNRGTALYRNEQYEEAQREFQIALNDRDFKHRDQIFHNMGNIAAQEGDLEQALELFRRALIENSENLDSRINYELVRQIMQQSPQESSGEGEDNENEDEQEQQQQQNQEQEEKDKQEAERQLQALEQKQEQERDKEAPAQGSRRGNFW